MVADKNLAKNLHMQVFPKQANQKQANQRIMIMTKPLILVTGATGKTGRPVVEQLLVHGYPVRALVHRVDERSRHLSELGAEVVVGDFHDLPSLRAAMKGIERAYFCYPPQGDRLLEAAANVAIAARDEGVEALVNMSQIIAREDAKSPLSFQHWQSEQVLDWAGIGAVHVNPTFFAEDLYLFAGPTIAAEGKMYLPFGAERHAPVTAEDIARVVVAILVDPASHVGRRYVITGSENMTLAEMAEVLTAELGKPVEYVDLPIEQWRTLLVEKVGFPESLVAHLAAAAQDHRDGLFSGVTDIVETITGRPPQSLAEFIRTHGSEFSRGRASARAA